MHNNTKDGTSCGCGQRQEAPLPEAVLQATELLREQIQVERDAHRFADSKAALLGAAVVPSAVAILVTSAMKDADRGASTAAIALVVSALVLLGAVVWPRSGKEKYQRRVPTPLRIDDRAVYVAADPERLLGDQSRLLHRLMSITWWKTLLLRLAVVYIGFAAASAGVAVLAGS